MSHVNYHNSLKQKIIKVNLTPTKHLVCSKVCNNLSAIINFHGINYALFTTHEANIPPQVLKHAHPSLI